MGYREAGSSERHFAVAASGIEVAALQRAVRHGGQLCYAFVRAVELRFEGDFRLGIKHDDQHEFVVVLYELGGGYFGCPALVVGRDLQA